MLSYDYLIIMSYKYVCVMPIVNITYNWPQDTNSILIDTININKVFSYNLANIPQHIIHIKFSDQFNQKINEGDLPSKLVTIRFGHKYNRIIDKNVLPHTIRLIIFGNSFNQPIKKGVLSPILEIIVFGYNFNQPIKGVLSQSLRTLVLGQYYSHPIEKNVLPIGLKNIIFGQHYHHHNSNSIPINTKIFSKSKISNMTRNYSIIINILAPLDYIYLTKADNEKISKSYTTTIENVDFRVLDVLISKSQINIDKVKELIIALEKEIL